MAKKTLFDFWNESLTIFTKDNLKLYLLGSLNNWKQASTIIIKHFWGILGAAVIATNQIASGHTNTLWLIINFISQILLFYIMIMTVRPSLERKDTSYYTKYLPGIWAIALVNVVYATWLFSTMGLITLLFFFDDNNNLTSLGNAFIRTLRVTLCFLPVIIALALFGATTNAAIGLLVGMVKTYTADYLWLATGLSLMLLAVQKIILLLTFSAVTVYYIKIKHSYYTFLFE